MGYYDILKDGFRYSKNIKSPSIYLDECFNIMNNMKQSIEMLSEEEVLKIDGEMNAFFTQNIEIPIVLDLKKKYKECKEILRKHQEVEKTKCTERNKKKLENKLSQAYSTLLYFKEEKEQILGAGHLTEKDFNTRVVRTEREIESLENNLATVENYCKAHGIEKDFSKIVIASMNNFINEKRKEMF